MKKEYLSNKITEIDYKDRTANIPVFLNSRFNGYEYDLDVLVYVL